MYLEIEIVFSCAPKSWPLTAEIRITINFDDIAQNASSISQRHRIIPLLSIFHYRMSSRVVAPGVAIAMTSRSETESSCSSRCLGAARLWSTIGLLEESLGDVAEK
ncbi:hypothetical protein PTI98_012627 [Pleurotus ostreatus]|nr:hypothetical protein PTI98_012627 [Pleurotus ostreatus]